MIDYGLVSIITPSYNCAEYITATIDAIRSQSYSNWELLITDDCSKDKTCEIIDHYCCEDSRIKLFRLETNSGAGVSRNNSIKQAKGRFIAFCDSDDLWYPEKLEKQLAFMTAKKCALSYTSYMTCGENGEKEGIVICRKRETLFSMLCDCGIGCLTAIYDTEKIGKVMMPLIRKRQDWGLWLKILNQCKVAYGMKEPLAIYRIRTESLSRNKMSLIKYNLAVYKNVLGWSSVKATLFFLMVFAPTYFSKKIGLLYVNR